jgi:hypothetical protein
MKWVTRGIRWVAGGLGDLGLAAPGSAAGAGEVGAPVVGVELPRGAAEAAGFAAAVAVAILAAARRREESVGELEPSSALALASSSMASSEAAFSAISWAFDVFPAAVEAGEVGATSGLVGGRWSWLRGELSSTSMSAAWGCRTSLAALFRASSPCSSARSRLERWSTIL